jgi:formylglycine-generating enzyme required for sulfatase activity
MPSPELGIQLAASRDETDGLFRLIGDDDFYLRPLPQRHRLIFYLGHLEAFDWNQVARYGLSAPHLDPTLDALFERGIDPEPGQLPADQPRDWPSLEETRSYVTRVRERLDGMWRDAPPEIQQTAIEHRWMHAETLAYQLHNLPHDLKRKPAAGDLAFRPSIASQRMITIPAGSATLGRAADAGFGWDNEFNETSIQVPSFAISKHKVTNGEYMAYVNEGHEAPFFWTCRDGEWQYRGMFEFFPLPLDAPVYVTQQQAAAFARWRGADLPAETQFHRAAFGTPEGAERDFPWGNAFQHPETHGNFDFQHWDPVPVTSHPGGNSAFGVSQLVGNGWEWTKTPFGPLPGFAPRPNYPGYSADFFDNQHFILKGASPRTAALLTRRSLRNWFRPDYPYLYATFRLVEN